MNAKKRREQLKLISATFTRLQIVCDHGREWAQYIEQQKQETKDHQRFNPGVPNGITRGQEMMLFACLDILRFHCRHSEPPEVTEYFRIRRSWFMGYAIFCEYRAKLMNEFSQHESLTFCTTIDYAALNQNPALDGTKDDNDKTERKAAA